MADEKDEDEGEEEERPKRLRALPRAEAKEQHPDGSAEQQERVKRARAELDALLAAGSYAAPHGGAQLAWTGAGARVVLSKGRLLMSMGSVAHGGERTLCPEEVLFLAETGAATVVLSDASGTTAAAAATTARDVWELCLRAGMRIAHYATYAHLRRLGFVVAPHGRRASTFVVADAPVVVAAAAAAAAAASCGKGSCARHGGWWPDATGESWRAQHCKTLPHVTAFGAAQGLQGDGSCRAVPQITYDVWRPASHEHFARTPPDMRVVVLRYEDPQPGPAALQRLLALSSPVPVRIALVADGTVTFFSVDTPPHITTS